MSSEKSRIDENALPAALDKRRLPNGRFVPGHEVLPGAGRPKGRKNFATLLAELPLDVDAARAQIAQTLGVRLAVIPELPDRRALLWWMREQQAFKGHEGAIEDLLTRYDAKPSRVQLEGEITHRAAPVVAGRNQSAEEAELAASYMESLDEP